MDKINIEESSNNKIKYLNLKIGIFIAILGIAGIIISQNISFTKQVFHPSMNFYGVVIGSDHYSTEPNPELKNAVFYSSIALFIIGGGIATFGSVGKKNS